MVGNSAAFIKGSVNCTNTERGIVIYGDNFRIVYSNTYIIYNKGYVHKQYKETLIKYSDEIRNTVKLTWFAVFSSGFS